MTELSMWAGLSYCNGDWNQLSLGKRGSIISAAVNDWAEEMMGVGGSELRFDSPVYLGGVPTDLIHPALASQSHKHGEIHMYTHRDIYPLFPQDAAASSSGCDAAASRLTRGCNYHRMWFRSRVSSNYLYFSSWIL